MNRYRLVAILGTCVHLLGLGLSSSASAETAAASVCDAPEFHQLDFMLGEWSIVNAATGKTVGVATNFYTTLDHCGITEVIKDFNGEEGTALLAYSRLTKGWTSLYVASQGQANYLHDARVSANGVQFSLTAWQPEGNKEMLYVILHTTDGRLDQYAVGDKKVFEYFWSKK